jgi:hypothetical protein
MDFSPFPQHVVFIEGEGNACRTQGCLHPGIPRDLAGIIHPGGVHRLRTVLPGRPEELVFRVTNADMEPGSFSGKPLIKVHQDGPHESPTGGILLISPAR